VRIYQTIKDYTVKALTGLGLVSMLVGGSGCSNFIPPNRAQEFHLDRKVAVLLIDMQEDFLENIDEEEQEEEIDNQLNVLDYAQRHSIPIFVLEYANYGNTIDLLQEKVEDGYKLITKPHDDGFLATNLEEELRAQGTKYILLMGINASACVFNTAQGGIIRGFKILTSKEIIAEPKGWEMEESVPSYEMCSSCLYRDDYEDLLEIISEGALEKEFAKKKKFEPLVFRPFQ